MRRKTAQISAFFGVFALFLLVPDFAAASNSVSDAFRSTNYPLPRFVTLGSGEVNVRTGPGRRFPVRWVYKRKGMPVEIVLEFESWRKIRDVEGSEGWVHQSLLSGRRAGFIQYDDLIDLHAKPKLDAPVKAKLENGVMVQLLSCEGWWCRVIARDINGWVKRKFIWGVYENENFD